MAIGVRDNRFKPSANSPREERGGLNLGASVGERGEKG